LNKDIVLWRSNAYNPTRNGLGYTLGNKARI